jgi:hypothetical protein
MKTVKITSWDNCHNNIELFRLPDGKTKKFAVLCDSVVIAYFDTQEKAALFFDGCVKGCSVGYSTGWDSCENNMISKTELENPENAKREETL